MDYGLAERIPNWDLCRPATNDSVAAVEPILHCYSGAGLSAWAGTVRAEGYEEPNRPETVLDRYRLFFCGFESELDRAQDRG